MASLSAKEAARELGIDARTFRKFMRSITPKDEQPGQGNRYHIEEKEIKRLKKQFAEWQLPKAKSTDVNGTTKTKKKSKPKKSDEAEELDAVDDPTEADLEDLVFEDDLEDLDEL